MILDDQVVRRDTISKAWEIKNCTNNIQTNEWLTKQNPKTLIDHKLTFSTVIIRPSRVERLRYLMHLSASSRCSIVTNPKPLDSRVRGSSTSRHSRTCHQTKSPALTHHVEMCPYYLRSTQYLNKAIKDYKI